MFSICRDVSDINISYFSLGSVVEEKNTTKVLLRVIVKLMLMCALAGFVWVLMGSVPRRDGDVKQVVRYNITDMQPGDHRVVEWHKKPLYIVYRKPEWEEQLLSSDASLYHDPDSTASSQPVTAENTLRSGTGGWFVTLGLGTGMGCALVFSQPVIGESDVAASGGFIDGCDQSRYDLAGRVYVNQQARRNTVVPKWTLVDGEILVGG